MEPCPVLPSTIAAIDLVMGGRVNAPRIPGIDSDRSDPGTGVALAGDFPGPPGVLGQEDPAVTAVRENAIGVTWVHLQILGLAD
jgi:hypothetical protein